MPRGVQGFFGSRLEEARLARGLTQTTLAQIIGRDSSTISSWEGERQSPDWEAINSLSSALAVRQSLFFKMPISNDGEHFYRSNASVTLALQKKSKARLRWAELIFYELGEWVEFPSPEIPYAESRTLNEISDSCIEQAASDCRKAWGLKSAPTGNVVQLIEQAGGIVVREELGGVKMDGVSVHYGDRPFILLAGDKASAARSRFDAAHELGHLVLHRGINSESLNKADYSELERQAHLFASAFLLPSEGFLREISRLDLDGFVELKFRWGVSIAAMIMRCSQLEIISPEYKQRLFKYMGARGWKKREPLDEETSPEKPEAIASAIKLTLEAGKYSKDGLLDLIGLNASDVEDISNLPKGFLSREAAPVVKLRLV